MRPSLLSPWVALGVIFSCPCLASDLLSKADALADVREAFQIIEDVHPDPYTIALRPTVAGLRTNLSRELADRVDRRELFLGLAPIVALLRDGHTSIRIPWQDFRAVTGDAAFPCDVMFDRGRLVVANDWSGRAIPRGARIRELNGQSAEHIVAALMPFQHAELLAARRLNISKYFREYLWAVFSLRSPFTLVYSPAGTDDIIRVKVTGRPVDELDRRREAQRNSGAAYEYCHLPDSNLGLLTYRFCQPSPRFDRFLRQAFEQIRQDRIAALVIDVRSNGGGSARANVALLDYVTDKRYRMHSGGVVKISDRVKQKVGRNRFENRFGPWDTPDGTRLTERDSELFWCYPGSNELRYRGPLYVLAGTQTQSSGMNLVCAVKDCQLGVVVGDETGDPATAFGDLESFRLSNSGLELYVSTKFFIRPNGSEERVGVLPDLPVERVTGTAGRDASLKVVKAHLARQ